MEVLFLGKNVKTNHSSVNSSDTYGPFSNEYNSCKTLQRKLELKVERVKNSYYQQSGSDVNTVSLFLFPISEECLAIIT